MGILGGDWSWPGTTGTALFYDSWRRARTAPIAIGSFLGGDSSLGPMIRFLGGALAQVQQRAKAREITFASQLHLGRDMPECKLGSPGSLDARAQRFKTLVDPVILALHSPTRLLMLMCSCSCGLKTPAHLFRSCSGLCDAQHC